MQRYHGIIGSFGIAHFRFSARVRASLSEESCMGIIDTLTGDTPRSTHTLPPHSPSNLARAESTMAMTTCIYAKADSLIVLLPYMRNKCYTIIKRQVTYPLEIEC